ncbi:helix-turn-helix transcriptional regulator [Streptomyces sp. NPDC003023]|uniref:helix-turn-helix transcriptional regulator n=1 Tax=Streptomyces sp. NPDC003023 TaxID=3364675 RepID=UPI0036B022D7
MKSDRLLSILLLLQTRGLVPASELAQRLEVSVRTVYRDVEALSAAGVPVYAERGRHGGIALLPGYRTDVTGLTADESRALFVLAAQGAHHALGLQKALGSALRKVMAALPEPHRPAAELTSRRVLVDPDRWMAAPRTAVELDTLSPAVFADRRLRLHYRHSGTTRPRGYTVDPYGLVVKAGVWYLVADHRGEPRLYRVDRVRSARATEEPVRRRPGCELADVWEVLRRQVEERPAGERVVVLVRDERLDLFLRIQAAQVAGVAEPHGDGWSRVPLLLPAPGAVRTLLAFGESVEVLEPAEAREILAEAAAAVVEMYRGGTGGEPVAGDRGGTGGEPVAGDRGGTGGDPVPGDRGDGTPVSPASGCAPG